MKKYKPSKKQKVNLKKVNKVKKILKPKSKKVWK